MSAVTSERIEIPGFAGTLFHPDHTEYDAARRVYNGMIDRRPAVIARCSSADDVVLAVNLARQRGATMSVFGGGHAVTGSAICEAGVMIDLRGMKGIAVDAAACTVRAEGGVNWGEFDAATQAHGLAVTGGRNPTTGIAGLTLGSGSGWLERKFAFACDNLIKAEVVTADGRKVVASEDENADLFWGLRGGGGNFGIVTAFHYRLYPLGKILGGVLLYPAPLVGAVLRFYRDFMKSAPDEVSGAATLTTAPVAPFVPEPARGKPMMVLQVVYAGDPEEGAKVLTPLRAFGPPVMDLVGPMSYVELQKSGPNQPGLQNYWTADYLKDLPDEAIDILAAYALQPISPETAVIVVAGGGALSRVNEDATAIGLRDAPWNIHYLCGWQSPADNAANIARVKALSQSIKPWATGQVYLNFIGDEGQERIDSSFGEKKMTRLRQLKRKWDPENLFRHNQNIKPAEASAV